MLEDGEVEEVRPAGRVIDLTFRNLHTDEAARKEYEAATDSIIHAILGVYGKITGIYRWESKRRVKKGVVYKSQPHLFIEFADGEAAEGAKRHQRETWKMLLAHPNPNNDLYKRYLQIKSEATIPASAPVALAAATEQKNRQDSILLPGHGPKPTYNLGSRASTSQAPLAEAQNATPHLVPIHVAEAPCSTLGPLVTGVAFVDPTLPIYSYSAVSCETSASVTAVSEGMNGTIHTPPPTQAIHIFPNPDTPTEYEAFRSLSDEELRATLTIHGEITGIYRWQKAPCSKQPLTIPRIFISFATPDAAANALKGCGPWKALALGPGQPCYESYLESKKRQEAAHRRSRVIESLAELLPIALGQSSQSDDPTDPTTSSPIAGSGLYLRSGKRIERGGSGQVKGGGGQTTGSQPAAHNIGPLTLESKEQASASFCSPEQTVGNSPSNLLLLKRKVAPEDSPGTHSPGTLLRPTKRPRSDLSIMATCPVDPSARDRGAEEQVAALRARVSQLEKAQVGWEVEGAELRKRCSALEAQLAQSREEHDRLKKTADSASIVPSLLDTFAQVDELLRGMAEPV
ncbi:hypothetical protein BOTBODRAFT_388862 [Botryobasidium botryosum FD-172 SS1]|uniref:Uncharacterized protein n=1 Tax=Botryobasidium botryosum (strain FD-172 SS1) TaxID=930990 RepID=A0A067N8P6_BOTB1|nr:hypothetical protein BOTBODRAFT_388862 [Botryobasidium botryosum FD-172 SS1]